MAEDEQADQAETAKINRMIDAAAEVKARAIVQSIYIQGIIDLGTAVKNLTDRVSSLEDNFIGLSAALLDDDDENESEPAEYDRDEDSI
jgi:hypothetical protein